MRVKTARWEPPMKPVEGVESLVDDRNVNKALWIGLRVVEFRSVPRFRDVSLVGRPGFLGILYHTQRANWHPSGNGLHHHFPELLDLPAEEVAPSADILKTAIGVEALLAAEVRANYLSEVFPDKEIALVQPGVFRTDIRVPSGIREAPLAADQLSEVHDRAQVLNVPLPAPVEA